MQKITIGRGTNNNIVINDQFISGNHLQITLTDQGQYILEDLGSSNGTYVNGHKTERAILQTNDIVKIGDNIIPWVNYFDKKKQDEKPKGTFFKTITIGRSVGNNIVINKEAVSSKHCKITISDKGEYFIEDLGSTNGTFVNNARIESAKIKKGEFIRLGDKTVNEWWKFFETKSPKHLPLTKKAKPISRVIIVNKRRIPIWLIILLSIIFSFIVVGGGFILYEKNKESEVIPEQADVNIAIDTLITRKNLPEPPEIKAHSLKIPDDAIDRLIKGCHSSGDYKELLKACDFNKSVVRNFAVKLASGSPGSFNLGQVCGIFDYCFMKWKYVDDPASNEFISSASNTIEGSNLSGDCDDFAVLIGSLILSIGGDVRINYSFNDISGHAFTEVNLGKPNMAKVKKYLRARYTYENTIHYSMDEDDDIWLNLDWTAKMPGGPYFNGTRGSRFYIIANRCEDF